MVKKRDTVWYYTDKDGWRRAKVLHVNRYWLHLKDVSRGTKINYHGFTVVDAALQKPTKRPLEWDHPMYPYARDLGWYNPDGKKKLYRKLGFV